MWSLQFWKDAVERAAKSGAQVFILVVVSGTTGPFNLFTVNVPRMAGFVLGAMALSVAMSIASMAKSPRDTASLVGEVKYQPKTPIGTP